MIGHLHTAESKEKISKGLRLSWLRRGAPRCVLCEDRARRNQHGAICQPCVDKLVAAQKGRCAICNRDDRPLVVDHDHNCHKKLECRACFRGILCVPCNAALGWYDRLAPAIQEYLNAS